LKARLSDPGFRRKLQVGLGILFGVGQPERPEALFEPGIQAGTPAELVSRPVDSFVATFTGAMLLSGYAIGTSDGLTEVVLESGDTAWSADEAAGPVNVAVYPWDVSLGPAVEQDSRLNHVTAPVASIAPLGSRVRVQVGPVVAEITAASAERLELRPGLVVTASFKATATRVFASNGASAGG